MKIGIGVQGRFHGFELAKALLTLGHDVHLFTNYPPFVVKRFGLPPEIVNTHYLQGALSKITQKMGSFGRSAWINRYLSKSFENWLARRLGREQWDISYTWSSVSERYLRNPRTSKVRLVARGSSHILTQKRLLEEEEARCGIAQEKPFDHTVTKELAEYRLAERVIVLSTFCKNSFLANGCDLGKVGLMVSGSPSDNFRLTVEEFEQKIQVIEEESTLNILTVGTFSFRKGMADYTKIVNEFFDKGVRFRFVGAVAEECSSLRRDLADKVEFIPRVAQADLKTHYKWGHTFLFPTIEDGFPTVMAQARAACLPQITTPNGGGYDVVDEGKSGWVFPIRSPELMIEKIREIQKNRSIIINMMKEMYRNKVCRTWIDSAKDFLAIAESVNVELEKKRI